MRLWAFVFTLFIVLNGCGGGGDTIKENKQKYTNINGRVVDGEIKDATVFFDINNNGILDANEPFTKSDNGGYFNLKVKESLAKKYNIAIVSNGGYDIRAKKEYDQTLMAFREQNSSSVILTPITTLIATDILAQFDNKSLKLSDSSAIDSKELLSLLEKAKKTYAELFDLEESLINKDPVELALKNNNLDLLKTNLKVNRVAKEIKKAIKKELKEKKTDAIKSFKALAKALKEAKKEAKKGDEALQEAISYIANNETSFFDKSKLILVKKSVKSTLATFNSNWKDSKNDILNALKNAKEGFDKLYKDTTPPKIEIIGDINISIEVNTEYKELGATAIDDIDGIVDVNISGSVDSTKIGKYIITYSAKDSSKNSSSAIRVVNVIPKPDTNAPIIILKGDNPLTLEVKTSYIEPGFSAQDDRDGNLTNKVVVTNNIDSSKLGEYSVVYKVQDSSKNSTEVTRVVNVVDTTAPTITLLGDRNITIEIGENYKEPGFKAIDNYDGDISNSVKVEGSVNTTKIGVYELIYSVKDSSSNGAEIKRVVNVIPKSDNEAPVITLNGPKEISIILGNSYKELGANAIDNIDGKVNVTITSNVDDKNIGVYKVIYSSKDSAGNEANVTRDVRIVDPKVLIKALNATSKNCNSWSNIKVSKDSNYFYTLNNNDWGRQYLNSNSTGIQCIFKYEENGVEKGGWYWGWPKNGDFQVKSYPEAIYGAKFKRILNKNSGFPALVSQIDSVNVDLAYRDLNITSNYNIALEFWLHTSKDTSMDNIEYEIMFRFDPKGFHPNRVKIGEVNLAGVEFNVYKSDSYEEGVVKRVFINFVAKEKTRDINIDFKKALDYLQGIEFSDIPYRYMSGIEMGVEVIDGSGALILDKFNVDLRFNKSKIEAQKLEEDFAKWSLEYSKDKSPFDKEVNINGSGLKWRSSNSKLVFRKKNAAIVKLYNNTKDNYFYTIFNKAVDLSDSNAAFTLNGSISGDYYYRVMLKDKTQWCISDRVNDDYLNLHKSSWYAIDKSSELTNSFTGDLTLPKIDFNASCAGLDFENIEGAGLFYKLKDGKNSGYFRVKSLALYQNLPKFAVFEKIVKEKSVSKLLFGLCTTPNRGISQNETFINNYKEWVSYLRWPGGSMIEGYNLKDKSELTYSVGKWTEFMKEKIPNMEFLIGVSSKRAYNKDWNATEYGYGLVNYLNKDYNSTWGDNEALSKALNLKFVEIGNEPNLEGLNAQKYGPVLEAYAKGIHSADSSVKVVAPTTTHGEINNMLPQVLKDYGDNIDIVSAHNYTDNPKDYKDDLKLIKSHINNYMYDNDRRKKDEIKIAFTEYNSLAHTTRKGLIHEESWAKVIWHAQSFSYFIQEGLYMASMWHAYINGGHALYKRDGTPYPLVSGLKFWREYIDFSNNPKVLYSSYEDKDIIITPIETDNKLTVFVVNSSPKDDKRLSIKFDNNIYKNEVTVTTLKSEPLNDFYDSKNLADNVVSSSSLMQRLQFLNPNAKIYTSDDNKTKIKFPKLNIEKLNDTVTLENSVLTYTFKKYTITVLELQK